MSRPKILEALGYRKHFCVILQLAVLVQLVTDNRQTDRNRATIDLYVMVALRGKNS